MATTGHPEKLGAALTHHWITTDFAEALLEFITPVDDNIDHLLTFLRDIHRYVARNIGDERMWPLMPCFIEAEQDIELAQFGSSNIGRMKTLYREGLKNRYGALMQTISGVHYNFSLPLEFWQARAGVQDAESGKERISAGYFRLIRNYYRFGWVIRICSAHRRPFVLRSSRGVRPICRSSAPSRDVLPALCHLATSERHGYTNKSQSNLGITFNDLHSYVAGLKRAIATPSERVRQVGREERAIATCS